jgi:hypothetical protein
LLQILRDVPQAEACVTGKDKPLARFMFSLEETCHYRLPGNLLPGVASDTHQEF